MKQTNLHTLWAEHLIEEFVRQGVRCFCASSGARCAPLTLALAHRKDIELIMHFDERASAFYALGYGRGAGQPAVWITTSGSAAAQGLPAVIEAAQDHVPMICLTADRPPELRDTGANQTMNQVHLFGSYARWFCDMPVPDTAIPLSYVLTTAAEAVARARGWSAGPVHINAMYREPLSRQPDGKDYRAYVRPLRAWRQSGAPYVVHGPGGVQGDSAAWHAVVDMLQNAQRGVIVVGRLGSDKDRVAARAIADTLSWPVLPDIGSGLRLGPRLKNVMAYADQMLLSEKQLRALTPDVLLYAGGPVVSKRLLAFMERAEHVVHVSPTGQRVNPTHRSMHVIQTSLTTAADVLCAQRIVAPSRGWSGRWTRLNRLVSDVVKKEHAASSAITEWGIAADVSRLIHPDHALYLGSSMPVRDMDMYGDPCGAPITLGANRGVSGIDGTVASAFGFAHALARPVTALMGDLAFLYDLNALYYAKHATHPVTLIVVNNEGGGIFSFLPFDEKPTVFEKVFGTPHGASLEHAAHVFGLDYAHAVDKKSFVSLYKAALRGTNSGIIEVSSERRANVSSHQALQARIRAVLDEA